MHALPYSTYIRLLPFALVSLVAAKALAAPDQIDVIGIVPGVSTTEEVLAKAYDESITGNRWLIGGFSLNCDTVPHIRSEGTISNMDCNFASAIDISLPNRHVYVNSENVFDELAKGFTEKFGQTSPELGEWCRGDHLVKCLVWNDSKGNVLRLFLAENPNGGQMIKRDFPYLSSITPKFSGRLELFSGAYLREMAEKRASEALERESNRRF